MFSGSWLLFLFLLLSCLLVDCFLFFVLFSCFAFVLVCVWGGGGGRLPNDDDCACSVFVVVLKINFDTSSCSVKSVMNV